ncbi:hypothetical protein K2X33_10185, partial [bacterium]|nr:hypothetical protein [bacterium]
FEVVNRPWGTAVRTHSSLVEISGKTGTSQVKATVKMACEKLPVEDRHHGWFVGYAPRENPEIAVAVIAEHSCHGSVAGPVAKAVIEAYIKKKNAEAGFYGPQPLDVVLQGPVLHRSLSESKPKQEQAPVPPKPVLGTQEDE